MTEDFDHLWRPAIHFTPQRYWMSDPCGLVCWKGEYHLFYQHNPFSNEWGPMHWGHAASDDLFTWKHHPIALVPDTKNGMIYTGSTVYDANNTSGLFELSEGGDGLVALYTGAVPTSDPAYPIQHQCLAYSIDAYHWHMFESAPVLANNGSPDFRDPKVVYHASSAQWIMVLAVGTEVRFYCSKNLKVWQYLSSFGAEQGNHEGVWECPDLIELPVKNHTTASRWLLLIHVGQGLSTEHAGAQYFVGDFDGIRFIPEEGTSLKGQWVDLGHDFYAAKSWANIPVKSNRTIWIAWASHSAYSHDIPTKTWRGVLTVPREISLRKLDGRHLIAQEPVEELIALRETLVSAKSTSGNSKTELSYSVEGSRAYEIVAELPADSCVQIKLSFHGTQSVVLVVDTKANQIIIDRSRTGMDRFSNRFQLRKRVMMPESLSKQSLIPIRVLWDRCILEVFVQNGVVSCTDLVFSPSPLRKIRITNTKKIEPTRVSVYQLRKTMDY